MKTLGLNDFQELVKVDASAQEQGAHCTLCVTDYISNFQEATLDLD